MKFTCFVYFYLAVVLGSAYGLWSPWMSWSTCSATCRRGYQYRTRFCMGSTHGSTMCPGQSYSFRDCYMSLTCTTSIPTPPPTTTTTKIFTTTKAGSCFDPTDKNSYRGTISKTKSGHTCQSWASQEPHVHYFVDSLYPKAGLGSHNYCRNPDLDASPWCFTNDKSVQWEHCDVPRCVETTTTARPMITTKPSANNNCGKPDTPLFSQPKKPTNIVGGVEAVPHSLPWQVSLRRTYSGMHYCGASILRKDWILTAAHCVTDPENPSSYFGIIGDHKQFTADDNEKRVEFSTILRHEQYNSITLENDITLMKTKRPITYNSYIKPICLPPPDRALINNEMVTVAGWGTTKGTGSNTVLRQASLPVVGNSKCTRLIGGIIPSMLCAGFMEGGKDSCQGDSGGPLIRKTAQGIYEQVGIVSWGYGCAEKEKPGVYTRVSFYIDWINNITDKN